MKAKKLLMAEFVMLLVVCFMTTGCAVNFYKQSPRSKQKIQELQSKVDELEAQRAAEKDQFEKTKQMLEQRLKEQIKNDEVSLKMTEGGLVIVLSDSILFDSGKAELKNDALPVLDKVISIIKSEVPEKNIGISGHTDNVPITHSSWKSNWELSTARSTNVLHYLEENGVLAEKLSATGYGEYRPVASNDTASGRAKNRRVEIVILPQFAEKRAGDAAGSDDIK